MKRVLLSVIAMFVAGISVNAQTFVWCKDGAKVEDGSTLEYKIDVEEVVPGLFFRYGAVTGTLENDLALYNLSNAPLDVVVKCVSSEDTGSGLQCCFGGQCTLFTGKSWEKSYTLSTSATQVEHRLQLDYFSNMGTMDEIIPLEDRTVTVTAEANGESHQIIVKFVNTLSDNAQTFEWRKDGAKVEDGSTLEYKIELEEVVPGLFYRYGAVTGALENDLALYNLSGAPLDIVVNCVSDDATGSRLQCCFGGQCTQFQSNIWSKSYTLSTSTTQVEHRLQLDYYSDMGAMNEISPLEDRGVTVTAEANGESHQIIVKFVNTLSGISNVSGSDGTVDVFDMTGKRVKAGISASSVSNLQSGLYIVRDCATKAGRKVMVK